MELKKSVCIFIFSYFSAANHTRDEPYPRPGFKYVCVCVPDFRKQRSHHPNEPHSDVRFSFGWHATCSPVFSQTTDLTVEQNSKKGSASCMTSTSPSCSYNRRSCRRQESGLLFFNFKEDVPDEPCQCQYRFVYKAQLKQQLSNVPCVLLVV